MMAHWIDVKEGKWKLRAEVIGFKAVSGNHGGENLGRHAVGLLDRVGIMDKNGTKVCCYLMAVAKVPYRSFSSIRRRWITQATTIPLAR
jgi:hypothetical protein